MVSCEKTKTVSFTLSRMKNIVAFPARFRFLVKWILKQGQSSRQPVA